MGFLATLFARKAFPWVLSAILAAAIALLWFVDASRIDGLTAERNAARESREMAVADATRWASAAQMRDGVIKSQKEQIDKLVKDAAESQNAALELLDQANARADATERKLAQLRKQANEASEADKPHPLSPAARAGLEWLRCRAKAGPSADPGACNGATGL